MVFYTCNMIQDDVIEIGKAPLRGNDMKIVRILQAIRNEPTLTDDQEKVVGKLIQAYENGDIPQNITKSVAGKKVHRDQCVKCYDDSVRIKK